MISSAGNFSISSRVTFDSPLAEMARILGAAAEKAAGSVSWTRSWTRNAPCSDSIIGGQRRATTSTSGRSPPRSSSAAGVADVMAESLSRGVEGEEGVVAQAFRHRVCTEKPQLEAGSILLHRRVDVRMVQHATGEHEHVAGLEHGAPEMRRVVVVTNGAVAESADGSQGSGARHELEPRRVGAARGQRDPAGHHLDQGLCFRLLAGAQKVKAERAVLMPGVRSMQWRIAGRCVLAAHPALVEVAAQHGAEMASTKTARLASGDQMRQRSRVDPGDGAEAQRGAVRIEVAVADHGSVGTRNTATNFGRDGTSSPPCRMGIDRVEPPGGDGRIDRRANEPDRRGGGHHMPT